MINMAGTSLFRRWREDKRLIKRPLDRLSAVLYDLCMRTYEIGFKFQGPRAAAEDKDGLVDIMNDDAMSSEKLAANRLTEGLKTKHPPGFS